MGTRERFTPKPQPDIDRIPFDSVEEAWFWFIQAQKAREDGARFSFGQGLTPRPCEPLEAIYYRLPRQPCRFSSNDEYFFTLIVFKTDRRLNLRIGKFTSVMIINDLLEVATNSLC